MQPVIEIKTLMYMLAISREGCFQKAADSLYISQPALSQYIKRIEDELAFPLYERDRGRCFLTPPGAVLLERGKALLNDYETMLEEMRSAAGVQDVRIGWPTGYTVPYFTKLFSYMESNYFTTIQVTEGSIENLIPALLQKEIDLMYAPVIYAHPDIEYTTVCHEEFYLGVPKAHPINKTLSETQQDGFVDLSYVKGMPFILIDQNAYITFFDTLFSDFNWKPNIVFACNNWDRALSLVAQGKHLAILPHWYADSNEENVVFYRIRSRQNNYRIFTCARRRNAATPSVIQAAIDYMTVIAGDEHAGTPIDQKTLPRRFRF